MTVLRPRFPALVLLTSALLVAPAGAAELPATAKAIVDAFEKGDLDRTVEVAETSLKAAPRDPATLLWVGRAFGQKATKASIFTKMSWAKKARTAWETGVEVDPSNVEVRRELIRYYVLAPGIAGGGDDKAEAQVAKIVAIDPVKGELARGFFFELKKKPADAEAAYRRAMQLDPKGIVPVTSLGNLLGSQSRWDEARQLFERRLAANPDDLPSVYQLGRFSAVSGLDLEKGIAYLDRYLATPPAEDAPTWADARWRRGQILEKLGKTPEAITDYRTALKLEPRHRAARRELDRLKVA